jgi:t-SNARE complex subunit (syntaxin)
MNMPKWAWFIVWVVIVLIVLVVFKVNVNLGSNGFSITQGIVH